MRVFADDISNPTHTKFVFQQVEKIVGKEEKTTDNYQHFLLSYDVFKNDSKNCLMKG